MKRPENDELIGSYLAKDKNEFAGETCSILYARLFESAQWKIKTPILMEFTVECLIKKKLKKQKQKMNLNVFTATRY